MPACVEALLNVDKVPHIPPNLKEATAEDRARLKCLCLEMAARNIDETDDTRFGDIESIIDEAARLAFKLGFPNPPVERVKYERSNNYEESERVVCRTGPAGVPFGWGERMTLWPIYRYEHPDYVYVFGYRLHDPDRGSAPVEMAITVVAETRDPAKPQTHDPWEVASKAEYRAEAVKHLRRWVRFIDAPPVSEAAQDKAAPEKSGEDDPIEASGGDCTHSPDYRKVTWYGKPYSFNKNRAIAIKHLWIAHEDPEKVGVHEREIGKDLDTVSANYKLRQTFRQRQNGKRGYHPAWREMIEHWGQGLYRLKILK